MKRSILLLIFFAVSLMSKSQDVPVNPELIKSNWTAKWITFPGAAQREYGVYHFRKKINLAEKPSKFIVHVSADNRYRLFVNGKQVCIGPARGDLYNWYYESLDIASFLKSGENIVAAMVWNMGEFAAVAQVSNQTGFLLQGNTKSEQLVNTDSTWKVIQNTAYKPCSVDNGDRLRTYMVIGPGDEVEASSYPWQWETSGFADTSWKKAFEVASPSSAGYGTDNRWTLVPRTIPLMDETLQRIGTVRKSIGITVYKTLLAGNHPLTIPANKTIQILLDQGFNTLAYPEFLISGGKGATVKVTYAESLFLKDRTKGNRNETDGKEMIGNYDIFHPDGGSKRLFRPLWQRCYRYIQLDIKTGSGPLIIEDLYGMATGYPFKVQASFKSDDSSLQNIWDVGWRTARLCAGETYYDCPYYEQLQYEGDTRIQSLISLYVTGDDRLMRKAINDFYKSRVPEGLTQGRYPSNRLQVIPPFSLFWVSMLHDYLMYRNDDQFVKQYVMAMRGVLNWYEEHIDQSKQMLGPMPWWNFVDWNQAFQGGIPAGANDGNSAVITLQYTCTLQQAADIFKYFGDDAQADKCIKLADKLNKATYNLCFNNERLVMSDTPDKAAYSQHASIMGILSGAIPENQRKDVMKKVLYDSALSQATFYYRFYLTLAMKKAGLGNLYYSQLKPWRDMLKTGLTTFAENPDPTRSDCHAWSSSPNYDFFATICGITPEAAGFKKVRIEPNLGELTRAEGSIPHPQGELKVTLLRKGKSGINAMISLPGTVSGEFIWNGQTVLLQGGKQEIKL